MFKIVSQVQISDFEESDPKIFEEKKFLFRLCENNPKKFMVRRCSNCGSHWEYNKDGEPVRYLMTCNSPFCQDLDCFKKRYLIVKKYFEVFFQAYKPWKTKRGSRWVHEVFGFPRIAKSQVTRSYLSKCKKQVYNFLRAREKKLNQKIKGIGVRDFSFDVDKVGQEFYFHFHFARRHFKFECLFELNSLAERYGLKYNLIGIRKESSLINYFSKRHAGYFGHKKDSTAWGFKDVFTVREYLDIFRGQRKTFSSGFSRKEIRFLKKRYIVLRARVEDALSSKGQQTTETKQCLRCGCKLWKWYFEEDFGDPPPSFFDSEPVQVYEVVKI